jgi:hypothetical protein
MRLSLFTPSWEAHPEHELKSLLRMYPLISPVQSHRTATRVTFPRERRRALQMWPEQLLHDDSLPPESPVTHSKCGQLLRVL